MTGCMMCRISCLTSSAWYCSPLHPPSSQAQIKNDKLPNQAEEFFVSTGFNPRTRTQRNGDHCIQETLLEEEEALQKLCSFIKSSSS